jgi:hypothetical protein
MMMARLEKPAPKLADKSLKDFPDVVEELVATSLSLKPDDRFQNMFEMEEALADAERELAEFEKEKTSEMGAGLSAGYPIRARKRRLRFSPVLALVSLGAIAFGTILVSRISEQEERIAALETIGQSKDTKPAITHDDLETGQVITRLKDDGRLWTSVYGLCTDDELYKIPHRERITNLKMVGDDLTTDNCKALLDMPLKGVDFKDSHINDRTLEMLGRINSLDFLRLERANGFTDAGIAFLQNCPSLVAIDLRSTGITDNTIAVIAGIKPLKRLDMERCSLIRGSNIEALKALPDLNELKLSESGFLSANLGKLRDLQELRTLVLHKSGITDQDVDSLLPLKLSKLEITHAKITDEGLLKLAQMKTLHELNVGSCKNITAAGVEKFRKLAPKCEIESD